jgi:hypothetical protein
MECIKCYIFNSELEAAELIKMLDEIKGLPTECRSTITYCNFEVIDEKIVIRWDDFIESVIGLKPQEIELPKIKNSEIFVNS